MNWKKLGICVGAAAITLMGASYLASPAMAAAHLAPCTEAQWEQADAGSARGCRSNGQGGGYASYCDAQPGGIVYYPTCQYPY